MQDPLLRGCAMGALRASPPSPFGAGPREALHNLGCICHGRMAQDEAGSSMARWRWEEREEEKERGGPYVSRGQPQEAREGVATPWGCGHLASRGERRKRPAHESCKGPWDGAEAGC